MQQRVTGVEIPNDVQIQCPAKDFALRRACTCCPDCEHFDAFGVMSYNPNKVQHFAKMFTIRCRHPIERRVMISVGD